jgi:glycerophosphoryl diester phosphodiesterase
VSTEFCVVVNFCALFRQTEKVPTQPNQTTHSAINPWLERRVLRYAHQGGAKEAPSSTMYAFHLAVDGGADALEMDVHRTIDGHLIVSHDETVDRTSPATGRIDEMTLAELQTLDFSYWWAPGFDATTELAEHEYPLRGRFDTTTQTGRSFGVATLREVLDAFPGIYLNFDIKGGAVKYEDLLADNLREYGRSTDVIVASFHDDAILRFRHAAPEIHTSGAMQETYDIASAIRTGYRPDLHPSMVALQIPYRFTPNSDPVFDSEFVGQVHELGLAVHVWTIDEESEMIEVLNTGADGIITDNPALLRSVFATNEI